MVFVNKHYNKLAYEIMGSPNKITRRCFWRVIHVARVKGIHLEYDWPTCHKVKGKGHSHKNTFRNIP